MFQSLDRIRKAARLRKKDQFTALFHHINVDTLRTAFYALKRKAAPGVDGMTWRDYEADLEPRLEDLHRRVQRRAYRPQPSRRTYIPMAADGKQRPLTIAALEDKIVQGTTVQAREYQRDLRTNAGGQDRRPHRSGFEGVNLSIKIMQFDYSISRLRSRGSCGRCRRPDGGRR